MPLKMGLNMTNSKIYISTHLTDPCPIQGDLKQDAELTLLTLLQNMPLQMSNKIMTDMNSRNTQLLVYADANLYGKNISQREILN
jgi:hypothetical protein